MEGTINGQLNGQVEFQFIRNSYPLDDKLYCYFTVPVTGTCKPEVGDWIGIYKVGWTGLDEVKCKKMINLEEYGFNTENGCGHVVFESFHLPKNVEHFYQFVYIKNGELVRGASKPFLFEETCLVGQQERMTEYGRQQQEIRRQIEKIEKQGQRQWQQKTQEPTLPQLIAQLRQNEERISSIKQQFEELRESQQVQPKKWIGQQWEIQAGMPTGIQTGMPTGIQSGMPTGIQTVMPTGIQTVMPTGIQTVMPTGIQTVMPTGIQTVIPTGIQTSMPSGIQTGMPTGIQTVMPTGIQTGMPSGIQTVMQSGIQTVVPTGIQTVIPTGIPTNTNGFQQQYYVTKYGVQQPLTTMSYGHKQSIQELQQGLQTLKVGLQELKQEIPRQQFQSLNWENIQFTQDWEQQLYQHVERKLVEQQRREQDLRQREQLMIQSQIKSCLRQLNQQEKRESRQRLFDEQTIRHQVKEFSHKLQAIRNNTEKTEEQRRHQEYQITRFESLLRERLNLECEKRQRVFQQMQHKLRECEQKLKEHQQTEYQFLNRHHQQLKERLVNFQQQIVREFGSTFNGQFVERQTHLQCFLRDLEYNFVEQQRTEQEVIRQIPRTLQKIVDEIEYEINDIECEQLEREVYGSVRRPRFETIFRKHQYQPKYQTKGFYYKQQIQQLEQQIVEFKRQLKIKSIQQTFEKLGFVGQEWSRQLVQKLKELEYWLRTELNNIDITEMPVKGTHIEKMLNKLCQQISFLETSYEIQHFVEESRVRYFLSQLRDLECSLTELQQQWPTTFGQYVQTNGWTVVSQQGAKVQQQKRLVKELVAELQHVVQMRIRNFTEIIQVVEMEPKCEDKLWQEIKNLEVQLQGIKQLDITIEQHEFKQLLNEFERNIREQQITGLINCEELKTIVIRQEQLYQQIRDLKYFWQQYKQLFARGYLQQQQENMQHYRLLCKLVNVVECHLVEFQTRVQQQLNEQRFKNEQQYPIILKKQLQLFQQIKNLKYYLPYEQHELVTILIKQKTQQFVQDCDRFLPVEYEVYQPLHKQIKNLIQHIRFMEFPIVEEQQCEVRQVLKHHLKVLKQLQQQVRECEKFLFEKQLEVIVRGGIYQPHQQYHLLLKQQVKELNEFVQYYTEFVQEEEQQLCNQNYLIGLATDLLTLPKFEDLNNNVTSFTYEPLCINMHDIITRFNNSRFNEQEAIVSELVEKYISCLNKPVDVEYRRRFEQLYVDNTKLGQMLRFKLNETAELRKQYEELQTARAYLEMKLVQSGNVRYPQYNGEEYEPKFSMAVERFTPIENDEQYRPSIKKIVNELEYQLNKMRFQNEECQKPGWLVRSQSGSEYVQPRTNISEECFRSVEGSLLVKLPQQQRLFNGEYQTRDEIIYQLQKQINKIVEQQIGTEYCQEQTPFIVCPVCDISLSKEIAQPEFELHVNSHFSD